MRIVAVADTHLYHEQLVVPPGDVFVHAGDLCDYGDLAELERAARWIRALPHPTKIVVAGNHDWAFVREPDAARALLGDEVVYLQDTEATVGGVRFWGSPWQPEFGGWAFNLPRGPRLAEKWALVPDGIDVLVTHGPPAGFGDETGHGAAGCEDLRRRVEALRPRLHLFGHIHQDGGLWHHEGICFSNVTTWSCERPPTVIALGAEVRGEVVPPRAPRRR